jgi:signal transduction histidine kinase
MHTITSEEILHELIHDLRQPLGNLETSVFYLDLVLDHPAPRVREQMRAMERQLAEAIELLHQATEELRTLRGQRGGTVAPESLPLTNSATAVVT